jgi:hypothetical protein
MHGSFLSRVQSRHKALVMVGVLLSPAMLIAAPTRPAACHQLVIERELNAGQGLTTPIGNGLVVYFQPIASGWILRVLPESGPQSDHDYAELATPPYQSVTPLSISTDFAFRAQDAIGWNPRRFKFATSAEMFRNLEEAYVNFEHAGATPPAPLQVELANQISQASEGTLTFIEARFIPGTANQWRAAAAVSSHFDTTSHTLVQPSDGASTPLGRVLWLRFRLTLDVPAAFRPERGIKTLPHNCGTR